MTRNSEMIATTTPTLSEPGRAAPSRVPAAKYAFIVLPFPPSVNGLYAGRTRRHKSDTYRAWLIEAGYVLNRQKPFHRFTVPVNQTIRLGFPDNRARDCFNYEKVINDLLVEHGILKDDSLVRDGRIMWDATVTGAAVEIWST